MFSAGVKPLTKAREIPPSMLELIARGQRNDEDALEQIIEGYQRRVAAMVRTLVHDDDWQDLCQQVFLKMVLGLSRLKNIETFESWLFTIARNSCFDHLRRRRAKWFFVPWHARHESIAGETCDQTIDSRSTALEAAILQLPIDQRELVDLMRKRNWTYPRLSATTGQSVATIKSRMFRARRRLRQLMEG